MKKWVDYLRASCYVERREEEMGLLARWVCSIHPVFGEFLFELPLLVGALGEVAPQRLEELISREPARTDWPDHAVSLHIAGLPDPNSIRVGVCSRWVRGFVCHLFYEIELN